MFLHIPQGAFGATKKVPTSNDTYLGAFVPRAQGCCLEDKLDFGPTHHLTQALL